jgi:hypothetical protein
MLLVWLLLKTAYLLISMMKRLFVSLNVEDASPMAADRVIFCRLTRKAFLIV